MALPDKRVKASKKEGKKNTIAKQLIYPKLEGVFLSSTWNRMFCELNRDKKHLAFSEFEKMLNSGEIIKGNLIGGLKPYTTQSYLLKKKIQQ